MGITSWSNVLYMENIITEKQVLLTASGKWTINIQVHVPWFSLLSMDMGCWVSSWQWYYDLKLVVGLSGLQVESKALAVSTLLYWFVLSCNDILQERSSEVNVKRKPKKRNLGIFDKRGSVLAKSWKMYKKMPILIHVMCCNIWVAISWIWQTIQAGLRGSYRHCNRISCRIDWK